MPMVMMSGWIAADSLDADAKDGRLRRGVAVAIPVALRAESPQPVAASAAAVQMPQ
jgi:hypothetical protein